MDEKNTPLAEIELTLDRCEQWLKTRNPTSTVEVEVFDCLTEQFISQVYDCEVEVVEEGPEYWEAKLFRSGDSEYTVVPMEPGLQLFYDKERKTGEPIPIAEALQYVDKARQVQARLKNPS